MGSTMIVLSGDTSERVMMLIIAKSENFRLLHDIFCEYLGVGRDCYLHFHSLSSRKRRQLSRKILTNLEDVCRHLIFTKIIVTRKNFRTYSQRIIRIIILLREKHQVDRVILGSDFTYYLKKKLRYIGPHIVDDRSIEVQVADVMANTYRRHRRFVGKFMINVL